MDWDTDDEGQMMLPLLAGFSVVVFPDVGLAIQLRFATGDEPKGERLQLGLSADLARELAAGLLKAAEIVGDTPGIGRLH